MIRALNNAYYLIDEGEDEEEAHDATENAVLHEILRALEIMRKDMKTLREIEVLAEDLRRAKGKYLEEKGWNLTCSTPGSYWMWVKVVPGFQSVAFYNEDDALRMESRIYY